MSDQLLRFQVADTSVRAEWVELSTAWQEVVERHSLSETGITLLGEMTAASLLLAATLKHQGSLTAQIIGNGPLNLMVVECQADGAFRATLKRSDVRPLPDPTSMDLNELINPDGDARFAITLDPKTAGRQAYQGVVPLEGSSMAQILERYMSRSEQLETRLWLAADGQRVAGLLLQKLPSEGDIPPVDGDAWDRLQKLAETLQPEEMLANDARTMMHRLFWQERLGPIESRPIRFECHCSKQKVAAMLQMLGQDELADIIEELGEVAVSCEYCNTPYNFDPIDVESLFRVGMAQAPTTWQ